MQIYVLKQGMDIKKLMPNLTEEQLKKVEEFSKDNFTEEELQKLETSGIDTSAIRKNSTVEQQAKVDVEAKIQELIQKYGKLSAGSGDPYTMDNPALKALSQAMNDGLIKELGAGGYSKNEIIDIIAKVFPVGINNGNDGKYNVPLGHDKQAKAIYDQFKAELMDAAGETEEMKAIREHINQLNIQIQDNNRQLQQLEYTITSLQAEIEENIEQAIKDSKEIVDNQKEDANNAVKDNLNKYTSSNGEMTYEEFQKNLAGDLDKISGESNSKLSQVILTMVSAQRKMATLNSYLADMSGLINQNKDLASQIQTEQANYDNLKSELVENGDTDCACIDPIGFTNGNVRYDFFNDADNNGALSNENEFLGSKNGFDEMKKLDTNDDGVVDGTELKASGLKVVKTDNTGKQSVEDVANIFKDTDFVDLKSYKSTNTKMSNGNTLLGTFGVNLDNNQLEGYNTFDKLDWLDSNYDFSDRDAGIGRFAQGLENTSALDFDAKYAELSQSSEQLQSRMDEIFDEIGVDSQMVKELISKEATKEADETGQRIANQFEQIAKKEEQETQEAEKLEEEKQKEEKLEEEQ